MKIAEIDLFYFALPEVRDIADGSQDSFLVRVRSDDGHEGFGESDASPLTSMVCYFAPQSHSNIVNIRESLIGRTIDEPEDIRLAYQRAKRRALDIAQFPHAYSAVDIALWDLLGRKTKTPVYKLLGWERQHRKRPYCSVLFQDTPEETEALARESAAKGFTAAKFGWGPMGQHGESFDIDLVRSARRGLGDGPALMVDAGIPWAADADTALSRAKSFQKFDVTWLEEPLSTEAVAAYGRLSAASPIPIAAGEGCDTLRATEDLLENGRVNFLQIDPGRIGGITPSWETYRLAREHGAIFVNHTYKSHVSLAAAMAVFAGDPECLWVEYCESGSPLVRDMVREPILPDSESTVGLPERPGIGVDVDLAGVKEFARSVSVTIDGKAIGGSAAI
jgi:L-alanine-DL-glutamate epimerase-like enolase superfamily enzyme